MQTNRRHVGMKLFVSIPNGGKMHMQTRAYISRPPPLSVAHAKCASVCVCRGRLFVCNFSKSSVFPSLVLRIFIFDYSFFPFRLRSLVLRLLVCVSDRLAKSSGAELCLGAKTVCAMLLRPLSTRQRGSSSTPPLCCAPRPPPLPANAPHIQLITIK